MYGWIPDLPDQRDFSYKRLALGLPPIPEKIDLRNLCSPVENQENLGSCTAQALVGNLEFLKLKSLKKLINFSRLFLYYNERVISHSTDADSGASLRDGIKTLKKLGDCIEDLWPYDLKKFANKPPVIAYKNAKNYQIISYYRLHTLAEMKHTLSSGWPFVFGFAVYESFELKKTARTGIVLMPKKDERLLGGHAVLAIGYDDSKKWFIVRNSWGKKWGDQGYFYMPYKYFASPAFASDFWTIRGME
ncbi:peptidase [bacterium]|nr:MAG: peptidase [bacterium]